MTGPLLDPLGGLRQPLHLDHGFNLSMDWGFWLCNQTAGINVQRTLYLLSAQLPQRGKSSWAGFDRCNLKIDLNS